MQNQEYDHIVKIMLIGDEYVGKTRFIKTITNSEFDDLKTIGVDFNSTTFEINNKTIRVQLWDTCGNKGYMKIAKAYYKHANAFMFCFDVTNKDTFNSLDSWIENTEDSESNNPVKIIVGMKIDLKERSVTNEEAVAYAATKNFKYYEASALDINNITEIVKDVVEEILQRI